MKLTAILLLAACLQVGARGFSQGITLNVKNATLEQVMKEIQRQSGYLFIYTKAELDKSKRINVQLTNADLEAVLEACFRDQPLEYNIAEKFVVLKAKALHLSDLEPSGANGLPGILHGIVVNEDGTPLEGASVQLKGSNRGVNTNRNGDFILGDISVGSTIIVSYTGFATKEIVIGADNVGLWGVSKVKGLLYVRLHVSNNELDQMQVIAYGKVSKRLNVGDVTTIKGDDILKNPVPNVLQALQGRVPGMFIQQNSGMPGASFSVEIRGQSSFGLAQPLYVVDGVTYPAGAILPLINPALKLDRFNVGNALNYFDPALIESVEILKDAAATSIYGSRGAYGVVLITTRKAKPGKQRLNVNTYTGVSVRGVAPKLLNTQQYLMLRREAFKNDGATPGSGDNDLNGTWDTTRYTDWQKEFTGKPAFQTKVNASYSGGTANTSFLIGGNYTRQGNVQKGKGDISGGGMNVNLNTATNDQRLSLSFTGSFSSSTNTMVPLDFSGSAGTLSAPNAPSLYLPNGQLDWSTGSNPAASYSLIYNGLTNNIVTGAVLKYNPWRGFTINTTLGYNLLMGKELYAQPTGFFNPFSGTTPASQTNSKVNTYSNRTWNVDPYLDYTTRVGGKGVLDATVGGSLQNGFNYSTLITGTNFVADAQLASPSNGVTVTSSYAESRTRYIGYFARLNFVWDNKYIIDLSGRRDGSTRFGPANRYGNFGAIGAGWIFTEEKWMKEHLPFLNYGKIKGSYGTAGGDNIADYLYLSRYTTTSNTYQGGISLTPTGNLANPTLHWEQNTLSEVSLELAFLKNRLSVETHLYKKRTTDQLITQPLSSVTGFTYLTINSPALIQNTGFEAVLNTKNIQKKDFSWTSSINITIPRNKLVRYPNTFGAVTLLGSNYVVGKSLRNVRLYQYDGVNSQTGRYQFTNAKGVTSDFLPYLGPVQLVDADRIVNVDLNPKYYGSIQNTIQYKGFMLDFLILVTSRKGRNFLGQQQFTAGSFNANTSTAALRRWQKPGDVTDVPAVSQNALDYYLPQFNFTASSGAYSDATYARLQNVYLSYTFPALRIQKSHITALSIYLQAQNVLTISKYKDLDPENLTAGAMPPLRVFTGGINITL